MADFTLNAPGTTNNPYNPANVIIIGSGHLRSDATGIRGGGSGIGGTFAHNVNYGPTITSTATFAVEHAGGDDYIIGAFARSGGNVGAGLGIETLFSTSQLILGTFAANGTRTSISAALTVSFTGTDLISCTIAISGGVATLTGLLNGGSLAFTGGNTTSAAIVSDATLAAGGFFYTQNTDGTYISQFTGTGVSGGGGLNLWSQTWT